MKYSVLQAHTNFRFLILDFVYQIHAKHARILSISLWALQIMNL